MRLRGLPTPSMQVIGEWMTQVKNGDTVGIHYTGTFLDGTTFDSSDGSDPLKVAVGSGQIIPGLDRALPGMVVGDKKTVDIPSELAYGPIDLQMRKTVPRDGIPDEVPLDIGTMLNVETPEGQAMQVMIVEIDEATVTIDANHPLAGKDLKFDIELMSIA